MLIGLKGCVHLVNFLVHEAKFQIDGGDLRVMLAYTCLENVESPVQILEAFWEIATIMVVHRQGRIAVAYLGMVDTQKALL